LSHLCHGDLVRPPELEVLHEFHLGLLQEVLKVLDLPLEAPQACERFLVTTGGKKCTIETKDGKMFSYDLGWGEYFKNKISKKFFNTI